MMTINQEQLDKARESLNGLQPNVLELTIKSAIEKLRPEIDQKLKVGLTYKEIGAAIYDGLGLETSGSKRENFWRSVVKFHKPAGKKTAKPARKSNRNQAEEPLDRLRRLDGMNQPLLPFEP
jgi:hypothetical protein